MSSVDWEEIKKLAADFQKTQTQGSLQKLSERNCVEIVKKLIELNLVQVIFTNDGKEYITPSHLIKEINDELEFHGGRVHLTDLVTVLNVDYSHIETKANELSKDSQGDISLVLGQLVNSRYKDHLAEEINERLEQQGIVTIAELTKLHDLPADFLEAIVVTRLGTYIKGVQDTNDSRTFFTQDYLNQYRSRITGVLTAVTRPVQLAQLVNRYKFPEKIFNSIIEDLMKGKKLAGNLSGRTYIPDIHARSQNEWIENFYKQNGYLEYDGLNRIGIQDPKSSLKKKPGYENLIYLESCCVGNLILLQVESAIEECIAIKSWVDLVPLLPSILSQKDIKELIEKSFHSNKSYKEMCSILCNTVVVTNPFLESCVLPFEPLMSIKAEEELKNGNLFRVFAAAQSNKEKGIQESTTSYSKKEERKKKTQGKEKSGGGTQGREVRTKAVKKKYKPNQKADSNSDEEYQEESSKSIELSFMSLEEVKGVLKQLRELNDCTPELIEAISKHINGLIKPKYYEIAKNIFMSTTASSSSKKKTHADIQLTISTLYANIVMFEKGLQCLEGELKEQLTKYLLKTLCTDAVTALISYISTDELPNTNSTDSRVKIINKFDSELQEPFSQLNSSLNKTVEEFLIQLDICGGLCDILLKKIDKKREKTLISEHRQNLIMQLTESLDDDPLVLHIAILLLFQSTSKQIIHASGKFVPQLLAYLKPNLDHELFGLLYECEQLVVQQIKDGKDEKIKERLNEIVPKIKELALSSPKKVS